MKNNLLGSTKYVPKPVIGSVSGQTKMFSLWDNELIEDYSERFGLLTPASTQSFPNQVVSQKLVKGLSTLSGMSMAESYQIPANKPFCIQLKANVAGAPDAYGIGLLAVFSETDSAGIGWGVFGLADRSLRFNINPDGTAASQIDLITPAGLITWGQDFHVAVERNAANLVTIYFNGVAVASKTIVNGSPQVNSRLAVRRGWTGKVWDMALTDAVVYGRNFTPPAKYTQAKFNTKYTDAVAADIVVQVPFRRDDPHCEVTGQPLIMAGLSQIAQGVCTAGSALTDAYQLNTNYWGAGDFTYECKFQLPGTGGIPNVGVLLPSHWWDGAAVNANNRFIAYIGNTGFIQFGISNGSNLVGSVAGTSAAGLIVPGKDYHFVVERIAGVVKGYLNGAVVFTFNFAAALWGTTSNRLYGTYASTNSPRAIQWWDLRIAKRAMYKGNVVKGILPRMPVSYRTKLAIPDFTLRVGSVSAMATYGEIRGFAKNFYYGGQALSIGELFPQVFWNATQNRMMKIKAIISQGGNYLVLAMEPTNAARDANTPVMTNTLVLNGVQYSMVSGQKPANGNPNETAVYYGTTAAAAFFNVDEALKTFSFA